MLSLKIECFSNILSNCIENIENEVISSYYISVILWQKDHIWVSAPLQWAVQECHLEAAIFVKITNAKYIFYAAYFDKKNVCPLISTFRWIRWPYSTCFKQILTSTSSSSARKHDKFRGTLIKFIPRSTWQESSRQQSSRWGRPICETHF